MDKTTKKNEEIMEQAQPVETVEDVKPYTFRKLETADVFPMFKLMNKIGFKELKDNEGLKKTLFLFMGGTADGKVDVNALGIDIFFEAASVLFEAIPKAETEIYTILSGVAGVKIEDIKKQPPAVTFEMIIDFCKKEEFKDFFSVVLKLFK
jgi:hypothetical protein